MFPPLYSAGDCRYGCGRHVGSNRIEAMHHEIFGRSGLQCPGWATIIRTLAVLVMFAIPGISQSEKTPLLDVQRLMTVSEFRQAGLQKLSAEELDALNVWLSRFAVKLFSSASTAADSSTPASVPAIVETQIEGEFEGWSGDTIFKLANGQIWQQSSYAYSYHYAYRPKVLIYKSGAVYLMKVDGVDNTIQVKRLK